MIQRLFFLGGLILFSASPAFALTINEPCLQGNAPDKLELQRRADFDRMEANHDGVLSKQEYTAKVRHKDVADAYSTDADRKKMKTPQEAFAFLDQDKDGRLRYEEWCAMSPLEDYMALCGD